MSSLKVEMVAADRKVWEGEAKLVRARSVEGDLGILPGHTPLLGVLVEGEISNCKQWSSGHLYFTLKDDYSQLKAVMFRLTVRTILSHKRRLASSVLSIVLGIAFLAGTLVFTDSLQRTARTR